MNKQIIRDGLRVNILNGEGTDKICLTIPSGLFSLGNEPENVTGRMVVIVISEFNVSDGRFPKVFVTTPWKLFLDRRKS